MLRVTPMTIECKSNHLAGDCNTGLDSTNGAAITGSVVDLTNLARHFQHAQPFLIARGLANTGTGAGKNVKLDVALYHGDSSGGGDLAEYDTGLRTAQQTVHTTALTTDEKAYTTGSVRVQHYGNPVSLLGVKRFITAAGIVTYPGVTTATADSAAIRLSLGLNLLQADNEPPTHLSVIAGGDDVMFSTSTST